MALRDQPYLPLYVQDYLTDEKLNSCTAATQGVYIKILCILHKSEPYGTILIKQKDKQKPSSLENFALKFARLLPFDYDTIFAAIEELIDERVLDVEDDILYQKRMVRDGEISEARSKAGKKGGGNPILFKQIDKQTDKQNTEYEYESESVNDIDKKEEEKEGTGRKRNTTKKQIKIEFAEFVHMSQSEYDKLSQDFGNEAADRMIQILDNYKGSKGKTYKDDFRAIQNWVVARYQEETNKTTNSNGSGKFSNLKNNTANGTFAPRNETERRTTERRDIKELSLAILAGTQAGER